MKYSLSVFLFLSTLLLISVDVKDILVSQIFPGTSIYKLRIPQIGYEWQFKKLSNGSAGHV